MNIFSGRFSGPIYFLIIIAVIIVVSNLATTLTNLVFG